jgi:sugar lactone lactonase YvrE
MEIMAIKVIFMQFHFLMKRKNYSIVSLCTAIILSLSIPGHAQTITTIAGGGIGDNLQATAATLLQPTGIAVDTLGNVYIADKNHNRIRKVTPSGVISTFAGNGLAGFSGDNIAATSARLNAPEALAIDRQGSLYIADKGNKRVRKVNSIGVITTVAGNGVAGYLGDGGLASLAEFDNIAGLAVDSLLDVFIADMNNHRVRKVNVAGIVTTVAGSGSQFYSGDGGQATNAGVYASSVAIDSSGNIYIGDANYYIRKVDQSGVISTIAGNGVAGYTGDNGPAAAAQISTPYGLYFKHGKLYVADYNNGAVRMIDAIGNIYTYAGDGAPGYLGDGSVATNAELNDPTAIAMDKNGNLFIADQANMVIRRVDALTANISTYAGAFPISSNGNPATSAALLAPYGVTADVLGNVFIADAGNHVIRKIDHSSGLISTVAGSGIAGFGGDTGPATAAMLNTPTDVVVDAFGNLYIADEFNHSIREVTTDGNINTIAGNQTAGFQGDGGSATAAELNFPFGLSLDNSGNIYIADMDNQVIRQIDVNGNISTVAGTTGLGYNGDNQPATNAELSYPTKVIADNQGNLYIADMGNHRIRKMTADGNIHTVAGNGIQGFSGNEGPAIQARLDSPMSIAIDNSNNLFISDYGNNRIRVVSAHTDTIIHAMAGTGTADFSGDGGLAILADINHPIGIFADQYGNVFIADAYNERIRKTTSYNDAVPQISSNASDLQLFPNPNQGMFTIQGSIKTGDTKAEITVLNAVGQLILMDNATTNNGLLTHSLSLGKNIAAGVYFVRIKTDKESQTIRFTLDK